jgi:hypothetical protein
VLGGVQHYAGLGEGVRQPEIDHVVEGIEGE